MFEKILSILTSEKQTQKQAKASLKECSDIIIRAVESEPKSAKDQLADLFELQATIDRLINVKCVEHYQGKHPKHFLWTGHYQFILDNISDGDKVFDVGTEASVSYTQELAKRCEIVHCCDLRSELVEISKKKNVFTNVTYEVLDITKEMPKQKYDVVILSHVLEHIDDPVAVLGELKKITPKIIVRLPRYDDHWMFLVKKDLGFDYFKDSDHRREYTLTEAVKEIERSGWNVTIANNDIDIKIVAVQNGQSK